MNGIVDLCPHTDRRIGEPQNQRACCNRQYFSHCQTPLSVCHVRDDISTLNQAIRQSNLKVERACTACHCLKGTHTRRMLED
ncbi:hypothetical protein C8R44DRAFT_789462 [Mycena epipterygia]|nr:hypothetical protein C8R44DRAFT_789462 [Mycena epipterygia]